MADSLATEWMKRGERAFERQMPMHTLYQALCEIFFPERASFFNAHLVGDEYYREIYDGYPVLMRWRLGNALGAMSRGRGREWFESVVFPYHLNERDDASAWCEDTTRTERSLIYDPRAQFGGNMSLSDQDYAVMGTSCFKVTTNRDNSGLLWATKHLSTVACEENGENEIDVNFERMKLTGRQLLQMFSERGTTPKAMKKAAEKDPGGDIDGLMLAVFPVDDYEPAKKGRRPSAHHKFCALYMDAESESVIQTEFFWSFPYVWRRWLRAMQGSPLAISPCAMVGLADAHLGQDIKRTMIEAAERAADPPQMIAAGSVDGALDLAPSGENYIRRNYDWRTGKPIQAIDNGAMPNYAMDMAKENREFQGQAWLINLLTLPNDREMTAYETERILDQDAREASPIFEPMEADNARMMARVFDVADHWGAFAERPQVLQKAEVRNEFETPVSLALRRLRAQQATQVIGVVGQFAQLELQAGQTAAYRRVDWATVTKDAVRGIGPKNWLRADKDVEADQQADQQEAALHKTLDVAGKVKELMAPQPGGEGGGGPALLPAPANDAGAVGPGVANGTS